MMKPSAACDIKSLQLPTAYSAPGTPPANRSSFVGVAPRDPGGLYQAQVCKADGSVSEEYVQSPLNSKVAHKIVSVL